MFHFFTIRSRALFARGSSSALKVIKGVKNIRYFVVRGRRLPTPLFCKRADEFGCPQNENKQTLV